MSSFYVQVICSETIRARAMKLGSCIHLEEARSTLCSIFRRPTFYGSLTNVEFLRIGHFLRNYKARAIKFGSCIHLKEIRSTLRSILSLDLLFTVH